MDESTFLKQNTNPKTLLIWQYFHPKLFQIDLNFNLSFLPPYRPFMCSGMLFIYRETTCCWNERWSIRSSVPLTDENPEDCTVHMNWARAQGWDREMGFSPREEPAWHRHTAFTGRQALSHLTKCSWCMLSKRESFQKPIFWDCLGL